MNVQLTLIATNEREAQSLSGILDMIAGNLTATVVSTEAAALPAAKRSAKEEKLSKKAKAPVELDEDDEDDLDDVGLDDEDEAPPAKQKPSKGKKPAPSDEDDDEEDEEPGEAEDDEEDDEAPPPRKRGRPSKEESSPAKSLKQDDIIRAFKTFAKAVGSEKAKKALDKFGVKSVRDLSTKDYPKVMELIKKWS